MRTRRLFHSVLMVGLVVGCRHGEPFAWTPSAPDGPFSLLVPRRLTFNPADDLIGAPAGGILVYTAFVAGNDGCLAFLPDEGGRRTGIACPDTTGTEVRQWLMPVPSPDGARIAFVREVLPFRGATTILSRDLVVAPFGAPDDATVLFPGSFVDSAGVRVNAFRAMVWVDAERLRFVGDTQSFGTNGTAAPVAVYEINVTAGSVTRLPGPPPLAWTLRADGGVWDVPTTDPSGLYDVAPDGSRTRLATIAGAARAVMDVEGQPVVLELIPPPSSEGVFAWRLSIYDRTTGGFLGALPQVGVPEAMRPVPGTRRAIVQMRDLVGADLWLVDVP